MNLFWGQTSEKTAYIACGVGCLVPNTDWQRFSGSCNLLTEIQKLGFNGVTSVTKIEFMLITIDDAANGKNKIIFFEIPYRFKLLHYFQEKLHFIMMRLFFDLTNIGVLNGSLLRITELRSSEQLLWTSTSKTVKDAPLLLKWAETHSHLEPLIINICMTTKRIQDIRKVQKIFN